MKIHKSTFLIILQTLGLLYSYSQSISADSTSVTKKKNMKWGIIFDIHYKDFFGSKYIDPFSPFIFLGMDITDKEYVANYGGYTKVPTWGGKLGVLIEFSLNKKRSFYFNGGFTFVRRRDVYKISESEIIKNQSFSYPLKIDIIQSCMELPLSILWKFRKIQFFFGSQLFFFSHINEVKDYIIPTEFQGVYLIERKYFPKQNEVYFIMYPFMRAGYEFIKKHYSVRPFIEIQSGKIIEKNYYLSIGIILNHHYN
jgi:hypothetical protein